jgi:hypothetical protein
MLTNIVSQPPRDATDGLQQPTRNHRVWYGFGVAIPFEQGKSNLESATCQTLANKCNLLL